jgi:hypothetical protein
MRGVSGTHLPLPAKGGGRGVGLAGRGLTLVGRTHPNPSLGREGL